MADVNDMEELTSRVIEFAEAVHKEQKCMGVLDQPSFYHYHLCGVDRMFSTIFGSPTLEQKILIFLHDVLEDGVLYRDGKKIKITGSDLINIGVPYNLVKDVELLTFDGVYKPGEYNKYIDDLCRRGSHDAIKVKYADNRFNRDTLFRMKDYKIPKRDKYDTSQRVLESKLREIIGLWGATTYKPLSCEIARNTSVRLR